MVEWGAGCVRMSWGGVLRELARLLRRRSLQRRSPRVGSCSVMGAQRSISLDTLPNSARQLMYLSGRRYVISVALAWKSRGEAPGSAQSHR